MENKFNRVQFGRAGERLVAEYLKKQGYFIVAYNYKSAHGEIDIIAENENFVLFVEVKTRHKDSGYFPREAVNIQKQKHIIYTAKNYIMRSKTPLKVRFDIAEILTDESGSMRGAELNYFENAFEVDPFEFY